METVARHIDISGLVQGVGFRPFIYRHATRFGLNGWVRNHAGGVEVLVEGNLNHCNEFIQTLRQNAPRPASISALEISDAAVESCTVFEIKNSFNGTQNITNISPDLAVCPQCLADLKTQSRRLNYPFTNCVHCGPRFSVVKKIPYDRRHTTMEPFEMCPECSDEYRDKTDRRFHAQTICCNLCGPRYIWFSGNSEETRFDWILPKVSQSVARGDIIAVKGTGGFHLICDATNEVSVRRLRKIKKRYSKPLAVMFCDVETLKQYALVSKQEEELLLSWRRPIVILESKNPPSTEVNRGFTTLGAILPYTAFHYMLMEVCETPAIVFTSANLKGQPLISDNQTAFEFLERKYCDALLFHNLEIRNKQDDSIVRLVAGQPQIIRRARGFIPEPVELTGNVEGILTMGADLKNSFAVGKGNRAILSQYIGDLENFDVFEHYCNTIEHFSNLFHFIPKYVTFDTHPEYLSSGHGKKLALQVGDSVGIETIGVQHHHAHIASVLAEHRLDEPVIGIAMDGTGYGDDGKIWGSEFFVCNLESYSRVCHMSYLPLPGGEKAIREPWRIAVAVAYQTMGEEFLHLPLMFHQNIAREKQQNVIKALTRNVNIFWSCGMGRLFDVVAALLNLVHISNFDGEGPVKLENIHCHDPETYPVVFLNNEYLYEPVIRGVLNDLLNKVPDGIISGRFHNTVAAMICDGAEKIAAETGLKKVALSGGIFQNRVITEKVVSFLTGQGFLVFTNRQVPCNDGGIALGQLAIAAKKTEKICV